MRRVIAQRVPQSWGEGQRVTPPAPASSAEGSVPDQRAHDLTADLVLSGIHGPNRASRCINNQ